MTKDFSFKKVKPINLENYPLGSRTDFYLPLFEYATGRPIEVPFIVVRGANPGPTLGISAAVHGNELNGIRIISNLLAELDLSKLCGSIICVPVVNIPGYERGQRYFSDNRDLNDYFPGKVEGTPAQQFARIFTKTFLPGLDYLVDIHTASVGRLNTMYVRADGESETVRKLAELFSPKIILYIRGADGTLRSAARQKGIPAITVEAGDPSVIQGKMVYDGELGIRNIMVHLGMIEGEISISSTPVVCNSSKWMRTTSGGLLELKVKLAQKIEKGHLVARTLDPFGNTRHEYRAAYDGVVIGRAEDPVAIPGTRFCHLGKI